MENYIEKGPERIPTKEEVMEIIVRHPENVSLSVILVRELYDEQGLYLLEAKKEGEKSGEFIEYLYMRKGVYPDKDSTTKSTINILHYKNGEPKTGWNIANYKLDTGEWEDVK